MAGRGIVLAFVLLFACAALAAAKGTSRGSVLVLVDDIAAKKTHKKFLKYIEDLGFETTVELGTSDKVQLKSFDSWLFDKLVILGGVSSTWTLCIVISTLWRPRLFDTTVNTLNAG
jgi:hypothetical protein